MWCICGGEGCPNRGREGESVVSLAISDSGGMVVWGLSHWREGHVENS